MSEDLKQAGGNQALETPVPLEAFLSEAAEIYDLRSGAYLGHTNRIRFTLDPWQPSLFALLPKKGPGTVSNDRTGRGVKDVKRESVERKER